MSFTIHINEEKGFPIILLTDKNLGTEAEIYAFGGLLNAFRVPVADKLFNIVDGYAGKEDISNNITNGFKSAKLSPFVCRMYKGRYHLNNREYQVHKFFLNEHAIHGLIYDAVYTVVQTEADNTKASVTLRYEYKGDDEGYPFPYNINLNWKLEAGNKLTVATTVSHHNAGPIPIADGWHPYFTLGGKVDEWNIRFNSSTQLEYDADLLPSGKKIKDTRFVHGCSLQNIELDNSFEFEEFNTQARCVLSNDTMQLTIEPDSSYPLLQLYIPDDRKRIAIENLSGAPDNFNNKMGLVLLPPDEQKTFTTSYRLALTK